jgi:hypothetical protein
LSVAPVLSADVERIFKIPAQTAQILWTANPDAPTMTSTNKIIPNADGPANR